MKTKIKQILLDTLRSAYDDGNIDNGGIYGGDNAVDNLYDLFIDEITAIGTAKISSRPEEPKKKNIDLLYTNPKTKKAQKLFDVLNPVFTVTYQNPTCGYKGEAIYLTIEANSEEEAKDSAMENMKFVSHITMKYYDKKYLSAYKPIGNYVIGRVDYYEGDPRL